MPERIAVTCAMVIFTALVGSSGSTVALEAPEVRLSSGMRILENIRIKPATYFVGDAGDHGVVVIAGDGVTVDFQGAELSGQKPGVMPDGLTGRGVVVQGKNVTLKNARIRGYKVAVYAENAPGLTIESVDVSHNYRQHLKSTVETEDLSDWLYGHENDGNEWLRYGAGIYLLNCPQATVRRCRARNGQNGLCLVRCDGAYVVDNDMSFMSGWGLAMWRSSRCDVFNNKFDWCIRGYSHGVYSRGQDSAGILVYEQCSDNVFAFNSATHGGDGFFLYAGNETLHEKGTGGCNNNLVYRDDFSHAAANGIEATFSRGNRFIQNLLDECEHGVWAGYSFDSLFQRNTIRRCRHGVSIEHGRDNRIVSNRIEESEVGVHLWWDKDEDLLNSAFGRAHPNCPSTGNLVARNCFRKVPTAIRLAGDTASRASGNTFVDVECPLELLRDTRGLRSTLPKELRERIRSTNEGQVTFVNPPKELTEYRTPITPSDRDRLERRKGAQNAYLPEGAPRGRRYIFVDEWGPYDFTGVRIAPDHITGGASAVFQLLGPLETPFRVTRITGAIGVTPQRGLMPAKLTVTTTDNGVSEFSFKVAAGSQALDATGVLVKSDWRTSFFAWNDDDDPRDGVQAWKRITAGAPLTSITVPDVDFRWRYAGPTPDAPRDRFATTATTKLELPGGKWRISTVSDDGVRVLVDGRTILANWTQHGPTPDEAIVELAAGAHEFRVEHFEIDGYAQLRVHVEPVH